MIQVRTIMKKGMRRMPVYEYKCPDCGQFFDTLRKMDELDKPIECPRCGGHGAKRQLSVFGVGSGHQGSAGPKRPTPPSCGGG